MAVAVIIPAWNHARFLGEAIASARAQSMPPAEIIVVDDGSTDDPAAVVAKYPGVRLLRQDRRGPSAARNAGLAAASAPFVVFLDADDRLLPGALAAGNEAVAANPKAAFAYGAHRRIDAGGGPISGTIFHAPGDDPYLDLIRRGNFIGMHAAVIYRRDTLVAAGGFREEFRGCEDYELFLRLSASHPIAAHRALVAEYRHHGSNSSRDLTLMLHTALAALDLQRSGPRASDATTALPAGRTFWKAAYGREMFRAALAALRAQPLGGTGWSLLARSVLVAPGAIVRGAVTVPARAIARWFAREGQDRI